jgi:hypothetical protein
LAKCASLTTIRLAFNASLGFDLISWARIR